MKEALQWLLDVGEIPLGVGAPLKVQWDPPLPSWGILALGVVLVAVIAASYVRERTGKVSRTVLAGIRVAVCGLVLVALCRPSLVWERNRVESGQVALLVDRSGSMGWRDGVEGALSAGLVEGPGSGEATKGQTRLELAVDAFLRDEGAGLRRLASTNDVELIAFAGDAQRIAQLGKGQSVEEMAQAMKGIVADGTATNLEAALGLILERTPGKRLAGIVLVSDGRLTSVGGVDPLLAKAAAGQVPVFPVAVGSVRRQVDLEVASVRARSVVFAEDWLLVEGRVSAAGVDEQRGVHVQLIDDRNGEVVDEKTVMVTPEASSQSVELTVRPQREGIARFRVQATPWDDEEILENNTDVVETRVLADRLKVLYVEGYPRFEYRFLKNALLREKSVELSVLLLEADENFVQEGGESVRGFPQTPEELERFDVVLLGDVDPHGGWISTRQMGMLVDFVGQHGGGLGLIAGTRHAPHQFVGTPLERLIPVQIDPQGAGGGSANLPGFRPLVSLAGWESRVLRFFADAEDNRQTIEQLPELFWAAGSLGPKPGALVLMAHPDHTSASGPSPILVQGRYGAGKLFYQATDDTWRWRRHTGEFLYDGYWIRVLRELMNTSRAGGDQKVVIRTDRRVYGFGQSVRALVEILDDQWLSTSQEGLRLKLARAGAADDSSAAGPGQSVEEFEVSRLGPQSNMFEGSLLPPGPGVFRITAPAIASEQPASTLFRVEGPDLESRHRQADHQMLERIAGATGGKVLQPGNLIEGLSEIRDRSVQIPDDVVESLWDSKLVFAVFVFMISIEWVARKVLGLL